MTVLYSFARKFFALSIVTGALYSSAALAGPIDTLQPGHWYEIPNTKMRSVLPSPLPQGNPDDIVDAYSGGAFDTKRNRLIIWGGGHAGYNGNEVYVIDVAAGQVSRLTNPTANPPPVHTYDQLEYLPKQDLFFAAGGAIWDTGNASDQTWLFDPNTNTWHQGQNMPGPGYNFWEYNMTTAYDPQTDKLLMAGLTTSGEYTPSTDSWALDNNSWYRDLGQNGAFDTKRRNFVTIGRGTAYIYPVNATGQMTGRSNLNATGDKTAESCDAPGFEYDPLDDRFVAWCGGGDVYSLTPDTKVWTRISAAADSPVPADPRTLPRDGGANSYHGTFGRWRYMPSYNAFVVYYNIDSNAWVYKFSAAAGSGTTTPPPASPTVAIAANPATVTSGNSTTLSWSSTNATSCTASGAWTGTKATSGQQSVGPLTTGGTYTLSCTGAGGTGSNAVPVTVQAASGSSSGGTTGGSGSSSGGTNSGSGSSSGGSTSGSGGATTADADWQSRSHGPGVVNAVGFDTQGDWQKRIADTDNCQAAYAPGCRANAWDPNVKASGAGSVRFDLLSNTPQGAAGNVVVKASEDNSVLFGANDEFWVQWRQRFDDYAISHQYVLQGGGAGGWKQIIIGQGDRNLSSGTTLTGYACSEAELVIENQGHRGYPSSYIECGRYNNFENFIGYDSNGSTILTRQNARVDSSGNTTCQYYPTGGPTSGCLSYAPNEWMTFMVHVKMGPTGTARSSVYSDPQPGFINSTYELYVARQGQPFQLAHRQTGLVIPRGQYWNAANGVNSDNVNDPGYSGGWSAHDGDPNAKYAKVWLTPYLTNKDPSEVTPSASIWYDEVIVATQPIPAPGGSAPPPSAPVVTLSANPTTVTAGGSTAIAWSSQDATSCTATGGWTGSKATSGQQGVGPLSVTTSYTLSCSGAGGTASQSVSVTVQPAAGGSSSGGSSSGGSSSGGSGSSSSSSGGSSSGSSSGGSTSGSSSGGSSSSSGSSGSGGSSSSGSSSGGSGSSGSSSGGSSSGGSGSNQNPATPVLSMPSGITAGVEFTLTDASAYSDPDGDALASSDWQISRLSDFSILILEQTVPQRTDLTVEPGVLDPARRYFIRTRHRDARGGVSDWSNVVTMTTPGAIDLDLNHNGPTTPYQVSGFVDTNGDGVNDIDEGICNLKDAQTLTVIGIEPDQGTARCYTSVPEQSLPLPSGAQGNLPYGMFAFRIEGLPINSGSPAVVNVRVHLPSRPAGPAAWYKYDPATQTLINYTQSVTFDGDTAVIQLTDGGPGDADGVVNGVIVDPSGLAIGSLAGGGSGGGTSGTTAGASAVGMLGPMVIATFGVWRRRRSLNVRRTSGVAAC